MACFSSFWLFRFFTAFMEHSSQIYLGLEITTACVVPLLVVGSYDKELLQLKEHVFRCQE